MTNYAAGRSVRAMVLADRGALVEAEAMGRSAVEFALRTDFPEVRADAFVALAHAMRLTGADAEADRLVEQAIAELEIRDDVDAAARVRRQYQHRTP